MKNQKGFTLVELPIILYPLGVVTFVCGVGYGLYHFIELLIILYALGAITFVCGVGYVLYHFISKIW